MPSLALRGRREAGSRGWYFLWQASKGWGQTKPLKGGGDIVVRQIGFKGLLVVLAGFLSLLPEAAFAEGLSEGNTAWILTSTALVLFMTLPGLALFYAGLVQSKNVLSVLMHCFAIACLVRCYGWPAPIAWRSARGIPSSAGLARRFSPASAGKPFPATSRNRSFSCFR